MGIPDCFNGAADTTLGNVPQKAATGARNIALLALFFMFTTHSAFAAVCVPYAPDLISWWKGDGNPFDQTGRNDGTMVNGAAFTSGKVGQAFNFNGSSQYVMAQTSPSLDVTTQFTLQAWVKPANVPDSGGTAVLSKVGGLGGNKGYQLGISTSFIPACQFNASGEGWPTNYVTAGLAQQNTWTHISCTYDNDKLSLYINGILVDSKVVGAKSVVNSTSTLRISGDDNQHVYFQGSIDEVQQVGRVSFINATFRYWGHRNVAFHDEAVQRNLPIGFVGL